MRSTGLILCRSLLSRAIPRCQLISCDQIFQNNGYENYILSLKDVPSKKEIERQRRVIKARQKKMSAFGPFNMNFSQNSVHPGTPVATAYSQTGMNSTTKEGVKQNTSSMFYQSWKKKKQKEPELECKEDTRVPCQVHPGHRKVPLDQKNPYITQGRKRPLTNLSPYLKETRHISDQEEEKILEILTSFGRKTQTWNNYEEERFRRFLEIQDPEFRTKLLYCMREHVQETNLADSFFVRFRDTFVERKRSRSQVIKRPKTQKEKNKDARDKVMSRFLQFERDNFGNIPREETKDDNSDHKTEGNSKKISTAREPECKSSISQSQASTKPIKPATKGVTIISP
ncbi:unnamed protein product [Moneuplotes crassus]|uniref:Uncharacterized protein n=1 Tax=Euplotes crassus TaxID=5936 RepID=A0AAD1URD4_EUPCR|nr:unnamed protein product [Moneuplotes crassus]